jgi:hypothetical protein
MDTYILFSSQVDGNSFSELIGSSGYYKLKSSPATIHEDPEGVHEMLGFHPYLDIRHNQYGRVVSRTLPSREYLGTHFY